jgi:hypothetical protein
MAVFAAKGMPIFQLRADGKGTKNTGQHLSKVPNLFERNDFCHLQNK